MKTVYECEYCCDIFDNSIDAQLHEEECKLDYDKKQKVAIFSLFSIGHEFDGQQGILSVAACLNTLGFEVADLAEIYHDSSIAEYLEEKIDEIVNDLSDESEKFLVSRDDGSQN